MKWSIQGCVAASCTPLRNHYNKRTFSIMIGNIRLKLVLGNAILEKYHDVAISACVCTYSGN